MSHVLFEVSVTAIIKRQDGKMLLLKRAPTKKRFPNKWTVPGGHLELQDFVYEKPNIDGWWYDVLKNTVAREVAEESGLRIMNVRYLTDMTTINNGNVLVLSMIADLNGTDTVKLDSKESSDFMWASVEDAKTVNLIDGIYEELVQASKL